LIVEDKPDSRLEAAVWWLCGSIALGLGCSAFETSEWKIMLINGLLFAQPVMFFAITLPRALRFVGAMLLWLTLYSIYTAVLSKFGIGSPISGPEAKGNWFFYWMLCMGCGLVNIVFLVASLFGKGLSRL
jgi:hypothetical protein